jgi:hypothetical protein
MSQTCNFVRLNLQLMKHHLLQPVFVLAIALFLMGCREDNPGITFRDPVVALRDTTYITGNIPSASAKKILLEDITGVRCVNCPQAAEMAAKMKDKFGKQLVLMALYLRQLPQFTSAWAGHTDLRSDIASEIVNAVGVPTGLPNGYVDRHRFGNSAALDFNEWESRIENRKGESPILLKLRYENGPGDSIIFKTSITYTQNLSDKQHKLALYITENDIPSKQSSINGSRIWNGKNYQEVTTGYIDDFRHQHVLRGAVTQSLGDLLEASLERGRVFEKDFIYPWPDKWVRSNAYLVAVVIDVSTESVVDVEEIPLY